MKTNIEWADKSLNFYTWKCHKVSPGCKNCYMYALARRMGKDPVGTPEWRGDGAMKEYHALKSGEVVFVNSMSDTYHEGMPIERIQDIHRLIAKRPDVQFLLLTKRIHRAWEHAGVLVWPRNLWIGTSVESSDYLWRVDLLRRIPAAGHFLSAEPLLERLTGLSHYIHDLDWVIVGGESGPKRRPFDKRWAEHIRDMCGVAGVPFMFKQGSAYKPGGDRLLDGWLYTEFPDFDLELPSEQKKLL